MADGPFDVDPDIRRARTPKAGAYCDPREHERIVRRVFARSWQLAPDAGRVGGPCRALPWTWLPGSLDEPLVLTRDEAGTLRCLSNVCTHRGNLVVGEGGPLKTLRCSYHGRRFGLDGRFLSMPEFEGVADFPGPSDDLPSLPVERWGPLDFVGLEPAFPLERWLAPLRARLDWLPLEAFREDPAAERDYEIETNWMLYCDNYLEGFHIPFVHRGLAAEVDYDAYRTETFELGSLQLATASGGGPAFEPPAGHPDAGRRVAAWYFWLFPNLMLNFYPWGLSANVVLPLAVDRTRVRFLSWVWREELRGAGAGAHLHRVELEDEAVVRNVQRGMRASLYRRGRYSPARESGVHHFHRLMAAFTDGQER